jgi:hypothetical protein
MDIALRSGANYNGSTVRMWCDNDAEIAGESRRGGFRGESAEHSELAYVNPFDGSR